MATVILSRGALSIVAKEYYQKLDKAQEKIIRLHLSLRQRR
ncbi:hypothetical protein HMPREF1119_1007 [Haemophilus parainfluenzae HK2019]|uniref:Uncharacterized protein n=1 Tax=Haemophilus parainfluenzae HK2019 TaxID=1095746 RepID=A0ABP2NVL1_HAEPA|nr:hypothetical protein [Haemophilus parainfluenzae]EIJ28589.1 hypothetical protein HMPREF1119_1007 [Haemophilus parainfluenzae HK2019]